MSESTTKQRIREIVDKLPPETTVEEAMERLYLLAKIERGIAQADAGQTLKLRRGSCPARTLMRLRWTVQAAQDLDAIK